MEAVDKDHIRKGTKNKVCLRASEHLQQLLSRIYGASGVLGVAHEGQTPTPRRAFLCHTVQIGCAGVPIGCAGVQIGCAGVPLAGP